ncbi:unnamed protein product [Tilletia caries]|nr:unnamed protein product [Tilletia caries]
MDVLASDSSTQTQRRSSPMSEIARGRHVYVNEVVALDERYFLVELFFVDEDNHIWACGRKAQYQAPSLIIGATATIQIQTSTIKHTGLELSRMLIMSNLQVDGRKMAVINPLRDVAGGRMVYHVPMYAFIDDVSGASSKRWNKHHVCLVQNATMKPSMLCEEGSLKIFAVSNTATPQEICQALVASFENLSLNGVLCWDVQRNEEVLVLVTLAAMICDNPMAAELASNIGSNGAYSCRTCMFGGNKAFKQSDAGVAAATKHFGPLFTVASERFESFNAVVRQASIMSNRKRPSRDITRRIAVQETIRDVLAEAVYFDPERQTWQKTGLGCSRLLVGSEAGKEAILTMYGLKSQKTTVGESVSANDVVLMVACKELTDKDGSLKMSTRIAKVYECNESTKTLSLLPVWPRPRPSNPLLEATVGSLDELFVAPLSDLLGVLNANHNCRSQGCRPYEDTVRHRGSDLDIVVNDCLFRSAYVAKLAYQLWNPGSV